MYLKLAILAAALYGLYLLHDSGYDSGVNEERTVWQEKENTEIKLLNAQIVDLQDKGVKDRKAANVKSTRIAKTLTGELSNVKKERDAARASIANATGKLQLFFMEDEATRNANSEDGEEGAATVAREPYDPESIRLSREDLRDLGALRQSLGGDLNEIGYDAKSAAIQLRATQNQLEADRVQ
jgi:hypothetical protein